MTLTMKNGFTKNFLLEFHLSRWINLDKIKNKYSITLTVSTYLGGS
jgi:hypothetical protein